MNNCEYCGEKIDIGYKVSKKHHFKFCSKSCKTLAQRGRTFEELYAIAYDVVIAAYNRNDPITLQGMCKLAGVSSKTFRKYGVKYSKVLDDANVPIPRSKFQTSITAIVTKHLFPKPVISEHPFHGLINPRTNANLRVDIFIPSIPLVIECDGLQHKETNHYFNNLVKRAGCTPVIITDILKKNWLKAHDIPLVRIPYVKRITHDYVMSFLPTSLQ